MTQPPRRYEVAYKKDASGNVGKYLHIDEIGGIAEDKRKKGVLFCAVCSCAMHFVGPSIGRRECFAHDATTDESRCERNWRTAIASREPQSLSEDERERLFDISQYVQPEYCSVNVRRQDHSLCAITAVNPDTGTFVEFAMTGDGCLVEPYNRLCDANSPAAVMLISGAWQHTTFQRMVWIYKVPSILLEIRRMVCRNKPGFLHLFAKWASNLVTAARGGENVVLIERAREDNYFFKLETAVKVDGFLRNRVSILKKSDIKDVIGDIARPVINAGTRSFDASALSEEEEKGEEDSALPDTPSPPKKQRTSDSAFTTSSVPSVAPVSYEEQQRERAEWESAHELLRQDRATRPVAFNPWSVRATGFVLHSAPRPAAELAANPQIYYTLNSSSL